MNIKLKFALFLLIILNLTLSSNGERTKDFMYEPFNGKGSCFRRLNATHQTGCSSKRDGSTGIIHFVEEQSQLDYILKTGSAGNYMPIIPTSLLTQQTVRRLKSSEKISGLIIYNDTSHQLQHYSHELTCPNPRSNVDKTCDNPWNKYGTGILHEDLPFPLYYVDNDEDLNKMKDCFEKFNNFSYETQYTRSLCSIELDSFMFASIDTPTCIRRSNSKTNMNPVKFCDPLGGENIWSSLFPIENSTKKYIIVSTQLDTTSLFYQQFPGAVNPITGLVTFLATAELLKRMVGDATAKTDKNILFMLFNGETYDYIGSQRMVYDMENDNFPPTQDSTDNGYIPLIHINDISLFVQLSQLTKSASLNAYMTDNDPDVKHFYENLVDNGKNFTKIKTFSVPLPPTSLQSFIRARPNMSGLVLADHGSEYVNAYYNSIYDNFTNINYQYYNVSADEVDLIPSESIQWHTANVSQMLALSLYSEVIGQQYLGEEKSRIELVDELYNCYLLDPNCKVHQAVQRKKLGETSHNSYSFYVGVTVVPNVLTYVIGLTLGWLTSDVVTSNKTCQNDPDDLRYQYFNMSQSLENLNMTVCVRTTMNFTDAISPAFIITDYDWKSGKYSSWSESTWKELSVRMFLKPSAAHERFTIAMGSMTFVMSIILVYFIKSRSDILFNTAENCSPTNC